MRRLVVSYDRDTPGVDVLDLECGHTVEIPQPRWRRAVRIVFDCRECDRIEGVRHVR